MNPLFLRKNPTGSAKASPLTGFYTNFWKLADETDSIGGVTLVQSATPVDFTAGKIGNGGNFDRTPKALKHSAVTFGAGSITVSVWFKTSSALGNQYLFNYNNNSVPLQSLRLDSGVVTWISGGTGSVVSGGGFANGNWHLAIAYHDAGTGLNTLIMDNGTPIVSGVAGSDVSSGPHTLGIGSFVSSSSVFTANLQFVGMLDAVGVAGGKIPTPAQISAIWNGGAGIEPPF